MAQVVLAYSPSHCFNSFPQQKGVEDRGVALYTVPSVLWRIMPQARTVGAGKTKDKREFYRQKSKRERASS